MATLRQNLSLDLRDALSACADLGRVIGDDDGSDDVTRALASDFAGRLERVAAKVRVSVACSEVGI